MSEPEAAVGLTDEYLDGLTIAAVVAMKYPEFLPVAKALGVKGPGPGRTREVMRGEALSAIGGRQARIAMAAEPVAVAPEPEPKPAPEPEPAVEVPVPEPVEVEPAVVEPSPDDDIKPVVYYSSVLKLKIVDHPGYPDTFDRVHQTTNPGTPERAVQFHKRLVRTNQDGSKVWLGKATVTKRWERDAIERCKLRKRGVVRPAADDLQKQLAALTAARDALEAEMSGSGPSADIAARLAAAQGLLGGGPVPGGKASGGIVQGHRTTEHTGRRGPAASTTPGWGSNQYMADVPGAGSNAAAAYEAGLAREQEQGLLDK